jgi:methylmalonyl-CoA epimerase
MDAMERIDHIAIVVKDLHRARTAYETILGAEVGLEEESPDMGCKSAFLYLGELVIELIQPLGSGPIAEHLAARGQGLHHIAYRVKHLEKVFSKLRRKGIGALDRELRREEGSLALFLDPEDTGGVLTELVQR